MSGRARKVILSLLLLTVAAVLCDLFLSGDINADSTILFRIRLPRILTAILAGCSLSLGGLQMQSIFRNPLADPHILGISGGAAAGAAIALVCVSGGFTRIGTLPLAGAAFLGAALASLVVMLAASGLKTSGSLLIFGIMLGFISNAVVSIIQSRSSEESLRVFYNWSAGNFSSTGYEQAALTAIVLCISIILAAINSKGLDISLFGEDFAAISGTSLTKTTIIAILSCCMSAATVTAFCGPVGFVGIIAPHFAKALTKSSAHRTTIPASMLCGAIISVAADIVSQSGGHVIPVGSTMAVIGIPAIMYIILSQQKMPV